MISAAAIRTAARQWAKPLQTIAARHKYRLNIKSWAGAQRQPAAPGKVVPFSGLAMTRKQPQGWFVVSIACPTERGMWPNRQ